VVGSTNDLKPASLICVRRNSDSSGTLIGARFGPRHSEARRSRR